MFWSSGLMIPASKRFLMSLSLAENVMHQWGKHQRIVFRCNFKKDLYMNHI